MNKRIPQRANGVKKISTSNHVSPSANGKSNGTGKPRLNGKKARESSPPEVNESVEELAELEIEETSPARSNGNSKSLKPTTGKTATNSTNGRAIKKRKRPLPPRPIERVLDRLQRVSDCGAGQFSACCPAHNDTNPSLSVFETEDGKVLVNCHSHGCSAEAIVAAIGLKMSDLFPGPGAAVRRTAMRGASSESNDFAQCRFTNEAHPSDYWNLIINGNRLQRDDTETVKLARELGVTTTSLLNLCVGWDYSEECFYFPERDGAGRIIGILRRFADGTKKTVNESKRGLLIPRLWKKRKGPLLLVEGPSDTMAADTMKLAVIGRPQAIIGSAASHVGELLSDFPSDREIIVVGERDEKKDGRWPGRCGAIKTAIDLSDILSRPVLWALPPDGAKDTRDWLLAMRKGKEAAGRKYDPEELGQRLLAELLKTAMLPGKKKAAQAELAEEEPVEEAPEEESLGDNDDEEEDLQDESESPARFAMVDSAIFLKTSYTHDWLVKHILVANQPCVVGGPKKSLKTSLIVDLCVGLASGGEFLGKFSVPTKRRVGLFSGESGEATLQDTFRRICKAREVLQPDRLPLYWEFDLPRPSNYEDLQLLEDAIRDNGLEVVVFDPLYLMLLAGNQSAQASNLFDMGPILFDLSAACLDAGASPIFVHHTRQPGRNQFNQPELGDLAFAGIQEFVRQWLLIGRREKYEPGSGKHRLWLEVGGSAGHSSGWALDIDEGKLADDFTGRKWDVITRSAEDERQDAANRKHTSRVKGEAVSAKDAQMRIHDCVRLDDGATYTSIRHRTGLTDKVLKSALAAMVSAGILCEGKVKVPAGNHHRKVDGYKLAAAIPRDDDS